MEENIVETYSVQCLIQQTANININSHLLFGDAPLTCFGFYRPSSGMSFTKE